MADAADCVSNLSKTKRTGTPPGIVSVWKILGLGFLKGGTE
jgi:hypothetical protein